MIHFKYQRILILLAPPWDENKIDRIEIDVVSEKLQQLFKKLS